MFRILIAEDDKTYQIMEKRVLEGNENYIIDTTENIKDLKEKKWLDRELKKTCDRHNKKYYKKF